MGKYRRAAAQGGVETVQGIRENRCKWLSCKELRAPPYAGYCAGCGVRGDAMDKYNRVYSDLEYGKMINTVKNDK
jgi:hypothetical protein